MQSPRTGRITFRLTQRGGSRRERRFDREKERASCETHTNGYANGLARRSARQVRPVLTAIESRIAASKLVGSAVWFCGPKEWCKGYGGERGILINYLIYLTRAQTTGSCKRKSLAVINSDTRVHTCYRHSSPRKFILDVKKEKSCILY